MAAAISARIKTLVLLIPTLTTLSSNHLIWGLGLGEFFFLALANKKGGSPFRSYWNTSFQSTNDAFDTSPSTLSWPPSEYHSKTGFTQSILFARLNYFTGIPTNAHPGCSRFSGLSVSQPTFGTDNRPVEVDERSQYYPAANLVSVDRRPVWDVNGQSSSWADPVWDVNGQSFSPADPVNLWTSSLMNGDRDPNHAPIPGCQSMNVHNVNNFAFGPAADVHIAAEPSLAPYSDYYGADSNLNALSTRFEAPSGTMIDTSLGYNPTPTITDEFLSQNTLNIMEPEVLPENNDYFPQTQSTSPDEAINSEMSPTNQDEHERVKSAYRNTCMECSEPFKSLNLLNDHGARESHTVFMCKCGKGYTRSDVLDRHLKSYQPELRKYTCPHCKSHSGGKSFKRKDHLTQHIQGFHHIGTERFRSGYLIYLCPHSDCLQYQEPNFADLPYRIRNENKPFVYPKDFAQHMRTVHDDVPYPCDVSGCLRVRGKGYIRRRDLIKHRKREHPDAPKFKFHHSCRLPGCSGSGEDWKGIRDHYMDEHGYSNYFAEGLTEWWR